MEERAACGGAAECPSSGRLTSAFSAYRGGKLVLLGQRQLVLPCDTLVTQPIFLCQGAFQLLVFLLDG